MGKFLDGMIYGYGSASKYSKLVLLLLALLGVASTFTYATGGCGTFTAPTCAVGQTSATCTSCLGGTCPAGPACATLTSAGCAPGSAQCTDTVNAVLIPLCGIYTTVHSSIFLLGLALIVLGGILYAGGHIMPGQTKGTIQGYGMGFVFGGIIGVIISIVAPFVLSIISGQSAATISGGC